MRKNGWIFFFYMKIPYGTNVSSITYTLVPSCRINMTWTILNYLEITVSASPHLVPLKPRDRWSEDWDSWPGLRRWQTRPSAPRARRWTPSATGRCSSSSPRSGRSSGDPPPPVSRSLRTPTQGMSDFRLDEFCKLLKLRNKSIYLTHFIYCKMV